MTITKSLLIILLAPLAPVVIYLVNEGKFPLSVIIQMTLISYTLGSFTVLLSLLCHTIIKHYKKGLIISVAISELLYLAVLLVYMLVIDEKNKAENMMWLPVMIFFMIPFTLPMPLAISYGTGWLFSQIKKGKTQDNSI